MLISERIYEIMGNRGMSQKEFATQTGIAQSTVSDWKTKRINPSSDKLMNICEVLKVTPYELLQGTDRPDNGINYTLVNKDEAEYGVLEAYRSLSQEGKEKLAEYMQTLV